MSSERPSLAIIIPTYRFDALARDALRLAASIGSPDILVHMADNSENPEKHAFLRELASRGTNVVVTCHEKNIGPEKNWLFLVQAQTAPYICIAADDDCFGGAYFRAGLELVLGDPACSAGSGFHVSVAHDPKGGEPSLYCPAERREADPLERIRKFSGENSIAYTISKTSIIQRFSEFVAANPLRCPFNDYILAFHLLSMGTYRQDRLGYLYLYDNTNWQLPDAFRKSNSRHYTSLGMPEEFGYLTRLHWAVANVYFFSSEFRSPELSADAAARIIPYLFNRLRRDFLRDYYRDKARIDGFLVGHPASATGFARLLSQRYDRISSIFDDFEAVVAAFSPKIASAHRAFQRATVLPGTESITPVRAPSRGAAALQSGAGNAMRKAFGWPA